MGSWTRTPAFPGRVHRLLAVAVAAGCWLAVPSGASAQQGPALNVSGLTSAATSTVANAGSAVEATVTAAAPVAGPAQDAVKQVAGTVGRVTGPEGPVARVGAGAAKATEPVVERVTGTAPPVADVVKRVAPEAQPAVDDTIRTVTGTVRSAGHDGGAPDAAAERVSPVFTPLIPGPPIGLPGTPAGGGDGGPSSAPSGALELPADSEPAAGVVGGSAPARASVSFLL